MLLLHEMIISVIRESKGVCSHEKQGKTILNKVNCFTSCRTSQSFECTNVRFGSSGGAGGPWYRMVFSPWSKVAHFYHKVFNIFQNLQ